MFTNINIKNQDSSYQYIVEYENTDNMCDNIQYIKDIDFDEISHLNDVIFIHEYSTIIKNHNTWKKISGIQSNEYTPNQTKSAIIRLYFPEYSIDVYHPGTKYAFSVNTWINGRCIVLASCILERLNTVACSRPKRFCDQIYHECIEFNIIDPFTLHYSDLWRNFRINMCGETTDQKLINSTDSMLYFSLHPVENTDDEEYNKMIEFEGGQNTLFLSKNPKNYFNLNISTNIDKNLKSNRPSIDFKIDFNEEYNDNLQEYIYETYGVENCEVQYSLIIGNETDIYAVIEGDWVTSSTYSFSKDDIYNSSQNFTNGEGYKPGMFIVGSVNIFNNDDSLLYKLSNKIPFTPDIFRYFVNTEEFVVNGYTINSINLDELNMKLLNINVVNKIENKIVQTTGSRNTKSNIVQPIFYRSVESSDIVIHTGVIENICINLDRYKSNVETFYIQLGSSLFHESGRIHSGILFKINGKLLTKDNSSSVYFILNENHEVVTTGKYTLL